MPSPKEVAAMKERLIRNAQNVKGEQDWLKLTEFVLAYGISQFNAGIEAAAREAEERGCYQTVRTCNAFLDEQTILHSYHCPEAVSTAIRSLKKLEDAT